MRAPILLALLLMTLVTWGQSPNLQADLRTMMEWFAGEFNNFQQVHQEIETKVPEDLRHEHIHSIFAPVQLPVLGEHVFFVKQYMDGDEQKVYRQRVYHFHVNAKEKAIQLDIYSFANPEDEQRYTYAYRDRQSLADLKKEQLTPSPGCEVYWRRDGDRFIGYMKDKACNFISKRSGRRIFIMDSLQLTRNEIWIRDEAHDENGAYVFGNKAGIHHKLKRCRYFTGWAVVQKPNEEEAYYVMRNIRLHDQGQRLRVVDADGTTTPYWVELAEVLYQDGSAVLKLALYEEGKSKALAYTWVNPDARQIGINLRWIQAGFKIAPQGGIN